MKHDIYYCVSSLFNISKDPIYEQITRQIKDNIIKENLSEGELLPSIRNLAKELKRGTGKGRIY